MPVAGQRFAVFDASPANDPLPWMAQACRSTGVFLADINAVASFMAAQPRLRQGLVARGPKGLDPELARDYRAALARLTVGKLRVAVHSVVWLDYGLEPQATVLDFDPLEADRAKALRAGADAVEVARLVAEVRSNMEVRVARLPAERRLVLPAHASDVKKAAAAAEHLRKWLA